MTDCPCCAHTMVRCVHNHHLVWFCRHCWQEMPDLSSKQIYPFINRQLTPRIAHPTVQPSIPATSFLINQLLSATRPYDQEVLAGVSPGKNLEQMLAG